MARPIRAPWLLVLALAACAVASAPAPAGGDDPRRIVAIGDVHGAYDQLVGILRESGLLDSDSRWSGGRATLVQTGDLVDRGPRVRDVLDLMIALEKDAARSGGEVLVTLGNHEGLVLLGEFDPQYVTPEICAAFADKKSARRRDKAWESYNKWRERFPKAPARTREEWESKFPLGFLEYIEALGPDGRYGKWIRKRPLVVRVGDTAFLHAGIDWGYSELDMEELNRRFQEETADFDRHWRTLNRLDVALPFFGLADLLPAVLWRAEQIAGGEAPAPGEAAALTEAWEHLNRIQWTIGPDSPLWYRGFALDKSADLEPLIRNLGKRYQVRRFVSAHSTLVGGRIHSRLGGRVLLIDTGMLSSYYGGRASALEIVGDRVSAIYPGERSAPVESEEVEALGLPQPQ